MSCNCQRCKQKYKVDIIVSDKLWVKIKPKSNAFDDGLLCGSCIIKAIEKINKYGAFELKIIK